MIAQIINFSVRHKLIVVLMVIAWIGWGVYSLSQIPIGAVPDVTNNQVQVITTSRNLSTQDIETFITYPVELEMANLPGVTEIRSVSKFGLSVVTVVFEDDMGTYLPRQLIAEKLKSATEKIPAEFGEPSMGPITTGLGEIYQYILDVKPGYEGQYSAMDLRTIQDWQVKRLLSGIPGVVEVNTWGGFLKEYEVSINPQKLRNIDVTIAEILTALEDNNDIIGGGYIEKSSESYFIRGDGMVKSIDDINKIVVKNVKGIPIHVRDVGKVRFGNAQRFGAITGNGEGEKVLGQVMMLKNANSSEVIKLVKQRVEEIQETLPEGVFINPFLERTELIDKTTYTVTENLVLGALIVIFVLVLLLGNLRSGLIVASIIPLSLLFGISLMNIFGISANLMSLGAIDFGIIIDGAVIIIEYIVFRVNQDFGKLSGLTGEAYKTFKDELIVNSARKVMQPAFFGQIIILIVFIPILSLSGVEGKMFRPMALSFSFALIGAMILSLTYIPVVTSLFYKPVKASQKTWSHKIMSFINNLYHPIISLALHHKIKVLSMAVLLLLGSVWVFSRLGGEFVPSLDEGDYVVQPVLKTGTSLSKTVELMTELENILLDEFPEVEQVVTRIGAAEVPTDPMSMEEPDVIIKLRPKSEWVSAKTKDDLADKMKIAMSRIPGMDFEFTQPIEMRFNELITGVRYDLAIKVYGEDLDQLYHLGTRIESLITGVDGASDITVEKIQGLPQMLVEYNRDKIAQYGLNIKQVNRIVKAAFAGEKAGVILEGEMRFDLVIRLEPEFRTDISHLENLYVSLPGGKNIPLKEIAKIDYAFGPAKISRENTKRRIVIGINVRNRDVESLVEEIQGILDENLKLPVGYIIDYGGQFENLERAKTRLKVAVPIALLLIFIMLYFTFNSIAQALMVFSAIPLSAIGGVLLLWIRDMTFSISAGVGFIALFGIAVLNGIVLVEFLNELKEREIKDISERILIATKMRLRPVILTASAAALGFFPMAFSTSAGAEVQRPLATVVIGGLVSATLLTLVILPIIYMIIESRQQNKQQKSKVVPNIVKVILFFIVAGVISNPTHAQVKTVNIDDAVKIAFENNSGLLASSLDVERFEKLERTAFSFEKTQIFYNYEENNFGSNGLPLNVFGISQTFEFPTVYGKRSRYLKEFTGVSQLKYSMDKRELEKKVRQSYYKTLFYLHKEALMQELDSLYEQFKIASNRRYELGETNRLEKITVEIKQKEIDLLAKAAETEVKISYQHLSSLLQIDEPFEIQITPLEKLELPEQQQAGIIDSTQMLAINYQRQMVEASYAHLKLQRSKWLPDIFGGYSYGYGQGENATNYPAYQVGIGIPILWGEQKGNLQAAEVFVQIKENELRNFEKSMTSKLNQLYLDFAQVKEALVYYESDGLQAADEMIEMAQKSFVNGETGYLEFVLSLETAQNFKLMHLDLLNQYNQLALEIMYFTKPQDIEP